MPEWKSELRSRLATLPLDSSRESEIVDELSQHLEQRYDELRSQGISEEAARGAVLDELKGPLALADQMRHLPRSCVAVPRIEAGMPSRSWFSGIGEDFRLAARLLRATPIVSTVAILSLALGMGANTAMFSIANGLLLRPLPVQRPEQLAVVMANPSGALAPLSAWSGPVWEQIRARREQLFDTAFAFSARTTRFNLALGGQTDLIDGIWVSGNYFDALGVAAAQGRLLTDADDQRGGGRDGPVAVISHGFWQRRYAGAADAIGRTETIDGIRFTIVGVTPVDFFGANVGTTFDVALPLSTEPVMRGRDSFLDRPTTSWLAVMARLRDGQEIGQAQEAVRALLPHIREVTMPADATLDARANYLASPLTLESGRQGTSAMRTRYSRPILIILTVVGVVLLIACANIANLLIARGAARRHELSIRMALGASRWRLGRQFLVESLLLAALGAVFGLAVAYWTSRFLVAQLTTTANTVFLDVPLDWRVLAFTLAVTAGSALLFGVLPALLSSRAQPIEAMREQGRGAASDHRVRLSGVLVAGQVALSLVLVVTALLLVQTFVSLVRRDLGFERKFVLVTQLDLRAAQVEPAERASLYTRLADEVSARPGVASAGVSAITPVSGSLVDALVEAENRVSSKASPNVAFRNVITPRWFDTYGTRLIGGRDFGRQDNLASAPVAIVNITFAERFLDPGSPIGQRIRQGPPGRQGPWIEIVGVVADAVYRSVREPIPPTFYVPLAQAREPPPTMSLNVRPTSGPPESLTRSVAAAVGQVNSNVALTFRSLEQQVDGALVQERMLAILSGFFGALALLMATVGLYGVAWYAVSRRRNEIAIRMALGATPASVKRLVLARLSVLVCAGFGMGIGASLWASQFLETLLYGVEPRNLAVVASAMTLLSAVGLLAGWIPATRAARTDPANVLRTS